MEREEPLGPVLVTGADGFIGRNLTAELRARGQTAFCCTRKTSSQRLRKWATRCQAVIHLAGCCRPKDPQEYWTNNLAFTETLTGLLLERGKPCPVLFASSVQAQSGSAYGGCKLAEEQALCRYAWKSGSPVHIFRLPGVFGKWSRPDYNSVVATFCHRAARGEALQVLEDRMLTLCYIDDVVNRFLEVLQTPPQSPFAEVKPVYQISVAKLAETIASFGQLCEKQIPDLRDELIRKLYSTYQSFLPMQRLCRDLTAHTDARGMFAEFVRTPGCGKISVNRCGPGVRKGGHWHRTKHERFLVTAGSGVIRLRRVGEQEIHRWYVHARYPQVLSIPPGYVHDIRNTGMGDLVFVIWADENYDENTPDTIREAVDMEEIQERS